MGAVLFLEAKQDLLYKGVMSFRRAIKQCGIRQVVIARTLGVSVAAVSCWANERRPIPSEYVMELAEMLAVPAEELLPKPRLRKTSVNHCPAM